MEYATLANISKYLNSRWFRKAENLGIALHFLPDLLDPDMLKDPAQSIHWTNGREQSALIHGNYYNANDPAVACAGKFSNPKKTWKLLQVIASDEVIEYKEDMGSVHCRDNMLNKIHLMVSQTSSTKLNSLFKDLEVLPFEDKALRKRITRTIQNLHERGHNTYAVYLLALTAVFRDEVSELSALYSEEEIRNRIFPKDAQQFYPEDCVFFTDSLYMYDYKVYMFQNINEEDLLYPKASLSMKNDGAMPFAELTFESEYPEKRSYCYQGIPMKTGKTVYISMVDAMHNDALGVLTFPFEDFAHGDNRPMYFRSGFFLTTDFRYHTPQIQRVAIVKKNRRVPESELGAIKGLLRMSGKKIIFTHQELEAFANCADYQQEEWMERFKRYILNDLKTRPQEYCCITEDDIFNWQKGTFTSVDRIKAAYALRNYTESLWRDKNTRRTCDPPEHAHFLVHKCEGNADAEK